MPTFPVTLYKILKSAKNGKNPIAEYIIKDREMLGKPLDLPVTGAEFAHAKRRVNINKRPSTTENVVHTNKGKYDDEATKFLQEHGYNDSGDYDVIGSEISEAADDIIEETPTYPVDREKSDKLLRAIKTREAIYDYMKTKNPETYQKLAQILHERPTYDVNKRYKQIGDWKNRADAKYKEIVNPSGPSRRLSYANTRYTNMDDPIQGDAFNEDFDMFDLEDYIQRKTITNPYLKSYLEAEIRKLNPKDAYDAEIIRQLEQKL